MFGELTITWLPTVITLGFFSALHWFAHWFLFKRDVQKSHEHMFARQLIMLVLILVAVVAVVISLPISESSESQVLSLIGLLLSGLLAFSSTTIISNLVAGAVMRFTEPFKTGDYIRVKEVVGKVTERGLFDCEVQTENRELIAIPNSILINNAITTVRSSGTFISVTLSLGYDVHHSRISTLLKQAATEIELQDPFVHVLELGNFAVTYKVSGLLIDVKNLLTMRSKLHCQILDTLHDNDIEIMSPSFMNQRKVSDELPVLVKAPHKIKEQEQTVAEDIVFDKAEKAQQAEEVKHELSTQVAKLKEQISEAEGEQKDKLTAKLNRLEEKLKVHVETLKNNKKSD
ncbi:mechanosensitive ion channel domain-containing protein [Paraglaciecola hydrolytica]|uniref:Small-conductance mechanosensitive channel n=1 Tax=Paraglaciecola hydrolytica TaxID=1799789 RepID=A0A136A2D9_9ALTE|nr:mechanosensitive ion channel domain-containing protein [Paraglaciecola hydrolytica]KXI29373.1 mechanosensitive ion channel protein MscS [Paraglaciecola hydrolytica]